jgi:hypothetical protein
MTYRTALALLVAMAALGEPGDAGAQVAGPSGVLPSGNAVTDYDQPLTGDAYQRATSAALKFTGQGTVTETEAEGSQGSEVEVRLPDGRQVEVQLDQSYAVVGSETDDDGPNDVDHRRWDDDD